MAIRFEWYEDLGTIIFARHWFGIFQIGDIMSKLKFGFHLGSGGGNQNGISDYWQRLNTAVIPTFTMSADALRRAKAGSGLSHNRATRRLSGAASPTTAACPHPATRTCRSTTCRRKKPLSGMLVGTWRTGRQR